MSASKSTSAADWRPPSPEELQAQLTGYEVFRLIGAGGMGAVFHGRQVALDRPVAIKLLPKSLYKSEEGEEMSYAERFRQEAQALARLDHPCIIGVYDFGKTADDDFYFVMEFVDGVDIREYIEQNGGKLPADSALSIAAHVLDGLGYAHGQGILHRDIKPANVLLNREGRVKIADFGLAKRVDDADGKTPALTLADVSMGTPDYAAPEVTRQGVEADRRADIYAVGVMLYEMLTGEVPRGRWHPPSERVPGLDPRFDAIVDKALEANRDDRYSKAEDFRAALDRILAAPLPNRDGTGAVRVRLVKQQLDLKGTGPVKLNLGDAGPVSRGKHRTSARDRAAKSGPGRKTGHGSREAAEAESGSGGRRALFWTLGAGTPALGVALLLVARSITGDPSPPPAVAEEEAPVTGAYAVIGEKENETEIEKRDRDREADEKNRTANPNLGSGLVEAMKEEGKEESATPEESAAAAGKTYPVPEPGEYTNVPVDEPGPPIVGRWRSVVDFSEYARDGSVLGKGGEFFVPTAAAEFQSEPPLQTVLIRFRGFRGNSVSFEYGDGDGTDGRHSVHTGTGGGALSLLFPNAAARSSAHFDHQWYFLFHMGDRILWMIGPTGSWAMADLGRKGAEKIARLSMSTWNPHMLPYFVKGLLHRCDALIPTEDQLAELLAAKTDGDLRAIPWVPFPEDPELEAFHTAFDRVCEQVVGGDAAGAAAQAREILGRHKMIPENPYRGALEAAAESCEALLAIQKADADGAPWPDLKDNDHYRFDPATGHAFVMVPVFLSRVDAAAFAAKFGGHLATLPPAQDAQRTLIDEWLTERVPFALVPQPRGSLIHAYHLAAGRSFRSGKAVWSWDTGEPLPPESAAWRKDEPGPGYSDRSAAVLSWRAERENDAGPREMSLGWQAVKPDFRAFPLIEFPRLETRYPFTQYNHPAARDAEPGSTGDPLLDFELWLPFRWRESVTEPVADLDRTLRDKYAGALEQRARGIAKNGDLDAVLPWHYEIKTVRDGKQPPPLPEDSPEALNNLRGIWDAESVKIAAQREAFVGQAIVAADAQLVEIEKKLVQEGKIERAAEVQARRKQLAAREGLPDLTTAIAKQ